MSAKSLLVCTRAEASISILSSVRGIGMSMILRIVLVFIGVLADYDKPSGFNLTRWGLQPLSEAKDTGWFSEWSKGCPVSTWCGSGPTTNPLGTKLLFEHILDPDFCQYAKSEIDILTFKSNPGDEFVWQLSAVFPSQGDDKCCLVRWDPDPWSMSSEITKPLSKIHV